MIMKVDVVISSEGKISFYTKEGNFKEGEKAIEKLKQQFGVDIEITEEKPVEQHRHDDHEYIKNTTRAKQKEGN